LNGEVTDFNIAIVKFGLLKEEQKEQQPQPAAPCCCSSKFRKNASKKPSAIPKDISSIANLM